MGKSRFTCFVYRGKNGRRAPSCVYFIIYTNRLTLFD